MTQRSTIVTGAGTGLGAAFAKAVAAGGSRVLVNNRRHAGRPYPADDVVEEIAAAGGSAATSEHAVDDPNGPESIVQAAVDQFGGLDALVLNAGISGPAIKVGDGDTELRQVMEINFFANTRLVETALPLLRLSDAGRIVIVSSTGGLHGVRGRSAYAASKGAITAYGLSLADELRREGILVNVLTPYAQTKMTARPDRVPDPRLSPEGAAGICAWLASAACDRTGEIWVAGGDHMRAAKAMESRAAPFAPDRIDELAAMPQPRSFGGGEAAFADFYRDAFGED
ncbi:SDR family NAD(P)-dependent oxidoreductase [Alteriqipengyuania lutimaris]|uniref:SDR family NAD(P)-dependent oxidoreductase n=1 Tax=Alteriqipengyuania lutimaris TaxID=1538146 RepID=A0A395LKQ8_9SPHN|nr:SDR family NAD(P)-dependent oxidoreductase [Alteriqipengyuania lutimaris]MBB3033709.1 3-hydroxyacyl-CoA dehydrogenase/3a,7a,12a-trihydroxy-5b-cholest-24-enoyl-CoA hydratase [Alteriqipengyuania lutimaris]RDS77305.1 SDR family NAD(P)-dependent oxidoreductase [Alteriqipengyuania lutimaris]